ncbi:MAG: nitroreductase family protein [Candidatus Thermoplasmatota archaeon]|nr:nitroreductase family protein [Candidatus Thermoplasmatota archaeon]
MQENPVFSAILERRSVRRYTNKALTKEEIEKIIEAGRFAPSAKNAQPWRFIVITKRELIAELSRGIRKVMASIVKFRFALKLFSSDLRTPANIRSLKNHAENEKDTIFFEAPVLILVVCKKEHFREMSCACAAENMMLAAHSMSLGSCWIGYVRFLKLLAGSTKKAGVPKGHNIAAAIVFGHPENGNVNAPKRKEEAGIIKWIE